MDRRQRKTRNAIFEAFSSLLERKHYSSITIQDIIDEADIGRSTFYAHFNTKEELLKEMCTEIFEHVFSSDVTSEKKHDFSHDKSFFCKAYTYSLSSAGKATAHTGFTKRRVRRSFYAQFEHPTF